MRKGHVAVSGCRPPTGNERTAANELIYNKIIDDVYRTIFYLKDMQVLVHGDSMGVDKVAFTAAQHRGIRAESHPFNYLLGPEKGKERNRYVLTAERAFFWPAPWSRGTWHAYRIRLNEHGLEGTVLRKIGW